METRFQFLERLYLPGYMGLKTEDYDKRRGVFDFTPTEPPVTNIVDYMTPRGAHIFISQAGLCLLEYVLDEEGLEMGTDDFRTLTREGRMKIVELNQKYRKELVLGKDLQGRMDLTKLRWGRLPMIKMDFDIGNRGIIGNLTGVLAPKRMPQMNADILRS